MVDHDFDQGMPVGGSAPIVASNPASHELELAITQSAEPRVQKDGGNIMSTRVRWLGHACLLVQSKGHHVLIDPFLNGNPRAAVSAGEVPANQILVSHGHGDHVGDTVAIAKRTGATVLTNYEISQWLQQPPRGLTKVHGLQHGGSYTFD